MMTIIIVIGQQERSIKRGIKMFAQALSNWLARRGIHYGWVMVAVMFTSSLIMAGAVGLPGAFILPLNKEFGWDTAQISGALAIRFLLFGLMAPFAAAFIERYGIRRVVLTAQAMVLFGLLAPLGMTQLWQLVASWGVIVGVGTGLTALVLGTIVSTRWFTEKRGLVLGILAAAVATGQLLFLPLAAWLIESIGWRTALLPSAGAIVFAALLIICFAKDRPSDLGLLPYGEINPTPQMAPIIVGGVLARSFGALAEASRMRAFWILAGTFFVCGLSTNGLVQTHFIPFCADFGMPSTTAASVLAMMGIFDFVGTIASGYLSDKYDNRWLLFWYYGLRGLSLMWLPSSTFTVLGLSVFAVFYGLDWIATIPPTARLAAMSFGREKTGLIFGWIFASHQAGAAIAAFGAGMTRTVWLTYAPAFYVAGITCLIAALCVLLIGRKAPEIAAPKPVTA